MDAKQLRIGNYVYRQSDKMIVDRSSVYQIEVVTRQTQSKYDPILLTEEWLVKFGFIKLDVSDSFYIHSDFMSVKISLDLKMIAFNNLNLHQVKFDFVHDLQNLFYALISEELTIKE